MIWYRHEKPTDPDDPLADQNIKDRFFGINDPVADKLMRRYDSMPKLDLPEDKLVTTLYIGNLADRVSEKELRYGICHNFVLLSTCIVCKILKHTRRIRNICGFGAIIQWTLASVRVIDGIGKGILSKLLASCALEKIAVCMCTCLGLHY